MVLKNEGIASYISNKSTTFYVRRLKINKKIYCFMNWLKLISVLLVFPMFLVLPFPPHLSMSWTRSTLITSAALALPLNEKLFLKKLSFHLQGGSRWVVIRGVGATTAAETGFSASGPIIPTLASLLGWHYPWLFTVDPCCCRCWYPRCCCCCFP